MTLLRLNLGEPFKTHQVKPEPPGRNEPHTADLGGFLSSFYFCPNAQLLTEPASFCLSLCMVVELSVRGILGDTGPEKDTWETPALGGINRIYGTGWTDRGH